MSTLTPATFKMLVNQLDNRSYFLTSEEGSSTLLQTNLRLYNKYFAVELSELLNILILQFTQVIIARRLWQPLKSVIQDLAAFSKTTRMRSFELHFDQKINHIYQMISIEHTSNKRNFLTFSKRHEHNL